MASRPPLPRLLVVAVAATTVCLIGAVPALAKPKTSLALLTSVGGASNDDRASVDRLLRQALADSDGVELLSENATQDQVVSLAEMGLVCLPDDVACYGKLGIIAQVDLVVVPVVDKGAAGQVDVDVGVIAAEGKRVRGVKMALSPRDASALRTLARRALGLEADPGTTSGTGRSSGTA